MRDISAHPNPMEIADPEKPVTIEQFENWVRRAHEMSAETEVKYEHVLNWLRELYETKGAEVRQEQADITADIMELQRVETLREIELDVEYFRSGKKGFRPRSEAKNVPAPKEARHAEIVKLIGRCLNTSKRLSDQAQTIRDQFFGPEPVAALNQKDFSGNIAKDSLDIERQKLFLQVAEDIYKKNRPAEVIKELDGLEVRLKDITVSGKEQKIKEDVLAKIRHVNKILREYNPDSESTLNFKELEGWLVMFRTSVERFEK